MDHKAPARIPGQLPVRSRFGGPAASRFVHEDSSRKPFGKQSTEKQFLECQNRRGERKSRYDAQDAANNCEPEFVIRRASADVRAERRWEPALTNRVDAHTGTGADVRYGKPEEPTTGKNQIRNQQSAQHADNNGEHAPAKVEPVPLNIPDKQEDADRQQNQLAQHPDDSPPASRLHVMSVSKLEIVG